jgi:hypothetical protein
VIKYVFRTEGPVLVKNLDRADPQRIGQALEEARQATPEGGDMRATAIERARNRKNALNAHLEWDDTAAAHQYRLIQINQLICSIRVEDEDGEQRPAFISVTPASGGRRFSTPTEVISSLDLQYAVMRAAAADLSQWSKRYAMLGEICVEVEIARGKIHERLAAMDAASKASTAA